MPVVKTPFKPSIFDLLALGTPLGLADAPSAMSKPYFGMREIVRNNQVLPGIFHGKPTTYDIADLANSAPYTIGDAAIESGQAGNALGRGITALYNSVLGDQGLGIPMDAITSAKWRRDKLLEQIQGSKIKELLGLGE